MAIHIGDAATVLATTPYIGADLVFFSPPYFQKLNYGVNKDTGLLELPEYLSEIQDVMGFCFNHTKPGGAMVVNIADTWNNYSVIPANISGTQTVCRETPADRRSLVPGFYEKECLGIPWKLADQAREVGWAQRDTWVWNKCGGRPMVGDRSTNSVEYLLYFRKPGRGRRLEYTHYDRQFLSQAPVFNIRPASHPSHPCPWPEKLYSAIVAGLCPVGGTVIDPYAGTGEMIEWAERNGRSGFGVDLKDWKVSAQTP